MSPTPSEALQEQPTPVPPAPGGATQTLLWPAIAALLGLCSLGALSLAWTSNSRLQSLEQELVRRQASSQGEASEARAAARQAQDLTRETAAKVALLDARLAEVSLQRGQLEELIQSLSRSRDENVLGDIDAALRVALQQTTITGSAEPLVAALRQADERLARHKQPRLEGVRRAVVRDLDRVKAVSVVDVATLAIKLDEVVRLLDELPLLAAADKNPVANRPARSEKPTSKAPVSTAEGWQGWLDTAQAYWSETSTQVWSEAKSLLRVTRINQPEAMLIAPEQSYFLRENLKLRLLNARLALMSRQFDTAQSDLRDTLAMLDRYFDGRSRRLSSAVELLRQVQGQARQVVVPRPDDTLAALAAAGR